MWTYPHQATVTTELSAVLDEEERRWAEPTEGEDFQLTLAKTVIQVRCCPLVVRMGSATTRHRIQPWLCLNSGLR